MSKVMVNESIVVDAAPDKTWALVGDFAGLVGWFPAVVKSVVEGSGVGALRHLTMPDGNQLTERQETRNDAGRSYEYVVIAGALPRLRLRLFSRSCPRRWRRGGGISSVGGSSFRKSHYFAVFSFNYHRQFRLFIFGSDSLRLFNPGWDNV